MKTLLTSTALVAMLATSATANTRTLTSTATFDHVGNTGTNEVIDTVECVFVKTLDGSMSYVENQDTDGNPTGGGVWTLNDATVELFVRNGYADDAGTTQTGFDFKYALDKILVQPTNKAGTAGNGSVWEVAGSAEYPATIVYNTDVADVVTQKPAGWTSVTVTESTLVNPNPSGQKGLEIKTANKDSGTVKLAISGTATLDSAILNANTTYKVSHMVTCMQGGVAGPWVDGVDQDPNN